jgi:hypothetical protein
LPASTAVLCSLCSLFLLGVAYAFSSSRKAVNWRTVFMLIPVRLATYSGEDWPFLAHRSDGDDPN